MTDDIKKILNRSLQHNTFSRWMKTEFIELKPGYAKLSVKIREEMTNGLGICHGGIIFSIADTAAGLAANARGKIAIGVQNNINYLKKVRVGDVIFAETEEEQNGRSVGVYKVNLTNQRGELVAVFRGTVFKGVERKKDE